MIFSNSDRFKPPEIRKNLLKRVLGTVEEEQKTTEIPRKSEVPDIQSAIEEVQQDTTEIPRESEVPDIQSGIEEVEETTLRPLVLLDNINLDDSLGDGFEDTTQMEVLAPPESTLHSSTVPLPNTSDSYLEVITVRSPYSFEVESSSKSTRFITITQTLTSALQSSSLTVLHSTPLFDFDGEVPDPSPVLLEDIYDDSLSHQPLPTNFIDFDQELEPEDSVNQETIVPLNLPLVNQLTSEDVEEKPSPAATPQLEPSFSVSPSLATELGLAPAQVQYLQLLRAQLTDLQPKVVTLTAPVVETEETFETRTLTLGLAGKELVTTLVEPVGLTTRTSFTYLTTTLANPALPLVPSTTIVSSPVVQSTVITQTDTQQYRILFRNRPITTTLTNTKLITTLATNYITETVTLLPSNPLMGILG